MTEPGQDGMRALMLTGSRTSEVRQVPRPAPRADQALVRVTTSAVCGSDLPHYRKPLDDLGARATTVPGHEAVGHVVEAAADGSGPVVGTRVVVYQHDGCGHCDWCTSGASMFCLERSTLGNHRGGADAEFVVGVAANLLPIPDDVSDGLATLLSCNFGTAYSGFRKTGAALGDRVVVFGLGPVGCCIVALAAQAGAEVIAVDPLEGRRELAKTLGASTLLDPTAVDAVAEILALTEGRGPEVVIECSANQRAQAQVMQVVRPRGRVLLLGANNSMEIDPGLHVIRKELTILGSWVFTRQEFPAIVRAARSLPALSALLGTPFPADDAPAAIAAADAGFVGKALIDWS